MKLKTVTREAQLLLVGIPVLIFLRLITCSAASS